MNGSNVHFIWQDPSAIRNFRVGMCLHGHTMHSQECLWFLPRYLRQVPGLAPLVQRYQQPGAGGNASIDFSRAFWTPPLSPAAALRLEQEQIGRLALEPIVSLTDHDDIEAGTVLQVTANRQQVPVSVEWTVPYQASILHLGIHNLPLHEDRSWMASMAAYTSKPVEDHLPDLLSELARNPGVLIVLNHPFWLEEGVEEAGHRSAVDRFLCECLQWVHAFELNGTRVWKENAAAMALSEVYGRPVVSGGDRHAGEPAACLNLTNAESFAEFAGEVREGRSSVVFLPQYQESMPVRVLEAVWDILRPYPEFPGRRRWIDRFFYRGADGTARTLSEIWGDRVPWALGGATSIVQLLATTRLRSALRLLLADRGEVLP